MSSSDLRFELEKEIAEVHTAIREKETVIRNKAREQKQNGDRLDELTNAPAALKEIQSLSDQVKFHRHKVEKLEEATKHEEEAHASVRRRVTELEQELREARKFVPGASDYDQEPTKPPVTQSDVEDIREQCRQLESERETEAAGWRKRVTEMEGRVKEAEERKDKTASGAESKEQAARILDSKIKELKRRVNMLQKQNEALSKKNKSQLANPDMHIDPEAVAQLSLSREDSSSQSLRKSQEQIQSKPDLGY